MPALMAILLFSLALGLWQRRFGLRQQVMLIAGIALMTAVQYAVLGLS